ncbi:hypothetical protein PVK06_035683 [Gossypium arboreum]|uniref:Uncharacterized protein n=1 Tax=Gossypium arboreum TaxID=29729 RepID=A0ABR0NHG9_GOSAR|nr:hypothetical protein PVK06_035683 [Gossypium arboreum]
MTPSGCVVTLKENSLVVAGSSSPSCTSSSSSPIPAANMDALALLNVVQFVNSADSLIHTMDPPATIIILETIHQRQPKAPLGSLFITTSSEEAKVTVESLNFYVYNPEGKGWEKLQREWRQSTNFFISKEPEIEEADLEDSDAPEEVP